MQSDYAINNSPKYILHSHKQSPIKTILIKHIRLTINNINNMIKDKVESCLLKDQLIMLNIKYHQYLMVVYMACCAGIEKNKELKD